MTSILVDTNAYSAFKRGEPEALEVINAADSVALSVVVLGELLAGFRFGKRGAANLAELNEFLSEPGVRLLVVDSVTADYYADTFELLRNAGTPIPTNDIWIAATAIQHHLTLFSNDGHFAHVVGLSVARSMTDLQ